MKLIINYDLISALKNVNEPYGPIKIIRNNKKEWIKYNLPMYMSVNYLLQKDILQALLILPFQFGIVIMVNGIIDMKVYGDKYKEKSIKDLKKLVGILNDLHVNTDYEHLLKSTMYKKNYHISINKDKLPELMENKYILVPFYKYDGEIGETSILQEHACGSKVYTLSIGSPKKELKLAYANNMY